MNYYYRIQEKAMNDMNSIFSGLLGFQKIAHAFLERCCVINGGIMPLDEIEQMGFRVLGQSPKYHGAVSPGLFYHFETAPRGYEKILSLQHCMRKRRWTIQKRYSAENAPKHVFL